MNIPDINLMLLPGEIRNKAMSELEKELNHSLITHFEESKNEGPEFLAKTLIEKVESLVDELNEKGYRLGRSDYGGDTNYRDSEQWFCSGEEMGTGLTVHFLGFAATVTWVNTLQET